MIFFSVVLVRKIPKKILFHVVFSTLFSVFENVVKHSLSCLVYCFNDSKLFFHLLLWCMNTTGNDTMD